jgi:alkanesulfonate monooxygenase SsuD/methylene tetrahydromethanopterin reductase-like flavin-dependent oxidoreductase (luciferase family)
VEIGVLIGDVRGSVDPRTQLDEMLRQVDAAQRNGLTWITLAQHYLYGDLRCLQPVPTLARLAAELDPGVRVATTVIEVPLYHPVALAEELATLDIVTRGQFVAGLGSGYRPEEFVAFGVDRRERLARLEESVAVLRRLWTEDHVTHHGRFWTLDDVRPHLRPLQDPLPLWFGASRDRGVARAARLGGAWPVPPDTSGAELTRLLALYEDEAARSPQPYTGPHPIRREIVPAPTTDAAYARFEAMAKERLIEYARRSHPTRDAAELASAFRGVAAREAICGTPDECVARLAELAATAPVDPVLVRADWPGMSIEDVEAYLDDLGRWVVPPVRDIVPVARVTREPAGTG